MLHMCTKNAQPFEGEREQKKCIHKHTQLKLGIGAVTVDVVAFGRNLWHGGITQHSIQFMLFLTDIRNCST